MRVQKKGDAIVNDRRMDGSWSDRGDTERWREEKQTVREGGRRQ